MLLNSKRIDSLSSRVLLCSHAGGASVDEGTDRPRRGAPVRAARDWTACRLRQIRVAAGNGNNSAVQYHFGSKDKLVQAIFEYRLPRLHERRILLVAELRPNDLRSWVEC